MKGRTEIQMSTHSGLKSLQETRSKSTIAIRNDVERNTMITYDFIGIDASKSFNLEIFTNRNELSGLGQMIDDHPNAIVTRRCTRVFSYEVHRNTIPFPNGDFRLFE
ncbi:hypothetical protein Hanom_Chr02g00152341 [Helianthus anomalus]